MTQLFICHRLLQHDQDVSAQRTPLRVGNFLGLLVQVIGVQSEAAPAAYQSWKAGRRVEAPMTTFAEGLATRAPFEMPQAILRRDLDDFVLVGDDEIRAAMRLAIEKTRNLVEGAGAASLAAARKIRDRLQGKRAVLVLSGGNVTLAGLRELLI